MKKNWTIFNGLLAAAISLILLSGCSTHDNDTSSTVSGKSIQSPIEGARVFLDIDGDKIWDSNEPYDITDIEGNYSLKIPDDAEGKLCSLGGVIAGAGTQALPMMAPRGAKNITPITTLIAINPSLKSVIGEMWDVDPFETGVPGEIVQLKYVVESLQSVLASTQAPASSQMSAMLLLTGKFDHRSIKRDEDVKDIVSDFLGALQVAQGKDALPDSKVASIMAMTNSIIDIIDESKESQDLGDEIAKAKTRIFSKYAVNFAPSTSAATSVLPLPNDVVWSSTGSKVVLDTSGYTDPAKIALYTAVNKLELAGLSPNTPISIPLTSSEALKTEDIAKNLMILNAATFQPVTKVKVVQSGAYIKIYPLVPLDDGASYLVVLKAGIDIADADNMATLGKNPIFEMLKPGSGDIPAGFEALVPLKAAYAPVFAALEAQGLSESNILMVFSFKTASKTLSLADYAMIANTVGTGGNPDDMVITGLSYDNINSGEYDQMNAAVALAVGSSVVDSNAKTFTSLDITSLSTGPKPVSVPYFINNGDKYSDTVIIFQHGFTGYKEQSAALGAKYLSHPIVAMDLPAHGDRDATPYDDLDSGSTFLTSNLGQNRVNLYQSFFDISVFIQDLKAGKFDIDGDGTADTPTNVYFTGMSLGSITGSVAAKYNLASLDKVVLNVGGANFAAIFDTAKNELLTSVLDSFGLTKDTPQYFVTLGVLQLLMDPADPAYKVDETIGAKTVFENAYNDTIVSNIANSILSTIAGADNSVAVTDMSTDLSANAPYTDTVFMFGGDTSMTKNWMTHGFLLDPTITTGDMPKYPEAVDYLDPAYVLAGHNAVITLTTDFFDN